MKSKIVAEIKAEERIRIVRVVAVYRDLFHFSTKEYKLITDIIKKI